MLGFLVNEFLEFLCVSDSKSGFRNYEEVPSLNGQIVEVIIIEISIIILIKKMKIVIINITI